MKSKKLDEKVRILYAILATTVAKRANEHAECDRYVQAEDAVEKVVEWLEQAGPQAASWYYSNPR